MSYSRKKHGANAWGLRILACFAVLLSVLGCDKDELRFNIRFDENRGLKAGDKIYFDGNPVGEVGKVVYTRDGNYLVEVAVESNFTEAATRDSQFYIADDPGADGKKAIEIVQEKAGGIVLRDGETVDGSDKPVIADIFDHLQKEARRYQGQLDTGMEKLKENLRRSSRELQAGLENALEALSMQFSKLAEEMQKVPDKQELKDLEETLDRLAEEMKRAQETVREKIKNEVIPEIQSRLDALRDRLEQYNRQNEIDPLDRRLHHIRET